MWGRLIGKDNISAALNACAKIILLLKKDFFYLINEHFHLLLFCWLFGLGRLAWKIQSCKLDSGLLKHLTLMLFSYPPQRWHFLPGFKVMANSINFVCDIAVHFVLLISHYNSCQVSERSKSITHLTFLWGPRVGFNISRQEKEKEEESMQDPHVWPHHIYD